MIPLTAARKAIAARMLESRRTTAPVTLTSVVDATNLHRPDRRPLLERAVRFGRPKVAVVFDEPLRVCLERNRGRGERVLPDHVIRRQHPLLSAALEQVPDEGFDRVYLLGSAGHQ